MLSLFQPRSVSHEILSSFKYGLRFPVSVLNYSISVSNRKSFVMETVHTSQRLKSLRELMKQRELDIYGLNILSAFRLF